MRELAYVNGVFCDLGDAKIPIEDRGFQFADGVYEVVVAPGGRPFRLHQHVERLRRSAEAIELPADFQTLNLPHVIREGIRRAGFPDTMIYLQITRGACSRDHLFPVKLNPTIVATFKAKPVVDEQLRRSGVAVETATDIRWECCHIKSIALLPNVLLKNAARRRGRFDAILLGPDGTVRETTCANVFMIRRGVLQTHPANERILHGVTRAYVLECAQKLGIPCKEEPFNVTELLGADEAFLSSTTLDIMPVATIDDRPVGAGELTPKLMEQFDHDRVAADA